MKALKSGCFLKCENSERLKGGFKEDNGKQREEKRQRETEEQD